MGLFSSSKKTSQTTALTKTQDLRVGVEQGTAIGAEAVVGGSGLTTSVSDMGQLTQSFTGSFQTGLSGADVLSLMQQQGELNRQSAEASGRFAELALTSLSAGQAGQSIDWKQYIPVIVIGVMAIGMSRSHKR